MSMLKNRLKQLLHDARRSAGIPQRRTLPGGLTLQITQLKNGDVVLLLERRDVWPGANELDTLFKYWPEPLPTPRPLPGMHKEGKLHRLIARWPRPLALADAGHAAEEMPTEAAT